MSAIDWGRLSQPDFDRVVEAFFTAENADLPEDAYAVNGRGGDGGIDIHIRRGRRLTIVQLKCFPEGFSGGWADTRRDQIRDSFKSALAHKPDEWVLVVPATLTPGERKFVEGLPQRRKPKLTKPKVIVFGRPELDRLASKHLNLVVYFKRDELREAARDYQQETALLIDKDDLVTRVAALSKQTDTLHPDWRLGIFSDGDIVGTTLVAKNPWAAERSPITLTLDTAFGPDEEELRKSFDLAISFGTPGRIDLPASVVRTFTVDGPDFIAGTSENVEVTWVAKNRNSTGHSMNLVVYDEGGKPSASFPGKTTWVNAAARGASVHASFFDTFRMELLLPFDKSHEVRFSSQLEMAGSTASDIVRAVSLLEHLEGAHGIGIELDGDQLARLLPQGQPAPFKAADRDAILAHRDIASDLAIIQNATNRHFGYPEEVGALDRVYARCLRLLLEGQCIVLPGYRQITPKLNGTDGEHIRSLLSGEPMTLMVDMENFGLVTCGQEIYVGPARFYAPQVRAVQPRDALAALDAGTADGYPITVRAEDDYGFWLFLPGRYVDAADGRLRPVSLELDGFADAPDVARALEPAEPTEE